MGRAPPRKPAPVLHYTPGAAPDNATWAGPAPEREAARMTQSAKTADREDLTRRYGKEIFARLEGTGPLPFGPAWWDERLMEMTHGRRGGQAPAVPFRRCPAAAAFAGRRDAPPPRILRRRRRPRARLDAPRPAAAAQPRPARHALLAWRRPRSPPDGWPANSSPGRTCKKRWRPIARLRRRSLAFTVDLLGEATITEKEADESRDEYLELIDGLSREVNAWPANDLIDRDDHGPLPRVNVSVKLSALYSQFDAIDPERLDASRVRPAAADPPRRPPSAGCSSTSTWSSILSRI